MRKVILIGIAVLMLAASAAASPKPTQLTVAMRDPGCHWFSTGGSLATGKYTTTAVRRGPVTLLNQDEAALKIKGPGGTEIEKVGAKVTLRAKGLYKITMVGQAADDNHLKLTIR